MHWDKQEGALLLPAGRIMWEGGLTDMTIQEGLLLLSPSFSAQPQPRLGLRYHHRVGGLGAIRPSPRSKTEVLVAPCPTPQGDCSYSDTAKVWCHLKASSYQVTTQTAWRRAKLTRGWRLWATALALWPSMSQSAKSRKVSWLTCKQKGSSLWCL